MDERTRIDVIDGVTGHTPDMLRFVNEPAVTIDVTASFPPATTVTWNPWPAPDPSDQHALTVYNQIGLGSGTTEIEVLDIDNVCWIEIDMGSRYESADIKLSREDAYLLGQALVDRYI